MLYTAPQPLPESFDPAAPSVFIAGGISNCSDWQAEMVARMDHARFDVINPRRYEGLAKDGDEAAKQIRWEHHALDRVSACIFWFPSETLCPITLFELGKMLVLCRQHRVELAIGWHRDYQRGFDLDVQIGLEAARCGGYLLHYGSGWDELVAVVSQRWG